MLGTSRHVKPDWLSIDRDTLCKTLRLLRANSLKVTFDALRTFGAHRELARDNTIHSPFNIIQGCFDRVVSNWDVNSFPVFK